MRAVVLHVGGDVGGQHRQGGEDLRLVELLVAQRIADRLSGSVGRRQGLRRRHGRRTTWAADWAALMKAGVALSGMVRFSA